MKKALRKTGKVIARVLGAVISVLAVLCVVTLGWGFAQRARGHVTNTLPETPADFVPTVRLIAFTDTHNENENVADAIDTAYSLFDGDPVYRGVDGFFCLGDFTSIGTEPDYAAYAETLQAHVRPETPMINIHGNHEFKNKDGYQDLFRKYFNQEPDTVTVINGFYCVAFSGERGMTEWTFTSRSLRWLSASITSAEAKSNGKAVFVFQHPHPWGTVYGSTVWGDPQINVVLNGHTSVVDLSGHSHFPMHDPRSINQASYTAVGLGGLARFELDENYIVGQHPDGYDDAAEMCVIEADNDGSVRLRGYDLLSDTYFCDWYIDDVNDRESFAYTYRNLKAHDSKPVFPQDARTAEARRDENGEWVVSFGDAQSASIVHEYKVEILNENGKKIYSENFVNDYYVYDPTETASFRVGADTLESGKTYTVRVRAESAYHLYSDPIELQCTVQ